MTSKYPGLHRCQPWATSPLGRQLPLPDRAAPRRRQNSLKCGLYAIFCGCASGWFRPRSSPRRAERDSGSATFREPRGRLPITAACWRCRHRADGGTADRPVGHPPYAVWGMVVVIAHGRELLFGARVGRNAIAVPPPAGSHGAGRPFWRLSVGCRIGVGGGMADRPVGHPPYAVSGMVVVIAHGRELLFGVTPFARALLLLPLLSAGLTGLTSASAIAAWAQGRWNLWGRLYYTLVALLELAFRKERASLAGWLRLGVARKATPADSSVPPRRGLAEARVTLWCQGKGTESCGDETTDILGQHVAGIGARARGGGGALGLHGGGRTRELV